jgi:penicillin amidase
MRLRGFFISLVITLLLIFALNRHWGQIPPLGKFFSPQQGFWQNAEPVNNNFSDNIKVPGLSQQVQVWLDDRLVPHIFAQDDADAYYVQGYITAFFRLWQMEMQVRAAAGRLSEVVGIKALPYDRLQRRKGMTTAAVNSLAAMEADSATKAMLDAYTAGVNAYIQGLSYRKLPLEFKLLDYRPEPWDNLKTALLLKYMSDILTGYTDDLTNTNALTRFSLSELDRLVPDYPDSAHPIIPPGTPFYRPTVSSPVPPSDTFQAPGGVAFRAPRPDRDNGSNNWVVSGKKTQSGAAILSNDPHLGLNLPSLWFEVQIRTPAMNVYGASLPGAPGVIIGFNSFITWGVTNAERDVKDYYDIQFRDPSMHQYWLDSTWQDAALKVENIGIRGHSPFLDTIAYTVFGPVMFDPSFPDTVSDHRYLAVHWSAADSTNEIKTFYLLNHGRNFDDFKRALEYFACPGQNFAYADASGNIALWQQGRFPLRYKNFGKFILPGDDSRYQWKGYIPFMENPHVLDPPENYLFSANQVPTDTTYPYYYFGDFSHYRASRIAEVLSRDHLFTVQDMMRLQNDLFNPFAAQALPLMLHALDTAQVSPSLFRYLDSLRKWDDQQVSTSINPVLFQAWWDSLYVNIWEDDLDNSQNLAFTRPSDHTTIAWLLRDSTMPYIDDRNTPQKETLTEQVTGAFSSAIKAVEQLDTANLQWGSYRGTDIMHLAKIEAFSRQHLFTGGSAYTVNALKQDHGPSWRMIVQMSNPIEAYGVYPGGQSGNPGSRHYDDFIDPWLKGKYYRLRVLTPEDSASRYVKYRLNFSSKPSDTHAGS